LNFNISSFKLQLMGMYIVCRVNGRLGIGVGWQA
jgi:hypothetical protein